MLKPEPTQKRQLPAEGPLLLWRDRQGGGREGLALSVRACSNPKCECREVELEAWSVGANLSGIACSERRLTFVVDPEPKGDKERQVLWAAVDVDDGSVTPVGEPSKSETWALEWLRSELDDELLALLRQRREAAKQVKKAPPYDWRKGDWSGWKPGMDVGWSDIHADDEDEGEVILDDRTYVVGDYYCVEPDCECEEVQLIFWLEPEPGAELEAVGDVTVNPTMPGAAQFHAHGKARPLLKRLWAAWSEKRPVTALLLQRQRELRQLAPEIHRLFGKAARPTAGPNDRCPCGSGKKYKRCCMRA